MPPSRSAFSSLVLRNYSTPLRAVWNFELRHCAQFNPSLQGVASTCGQLVLAVFSGKVPESAPAPFASRRKL